MKRKRCRITHPTLYVEYLKNKSEKCFMLVHSPGTNLTQMNYYNKLLINEGHSVVSFDMRNCGKSKKGDISIDSHIKDINLIIDKMKDKHIFLIINCASCNLLIGLINHPSIKGAIFINPVNVSFSSLKVKLFPLVEAVSKLLSLFSDHSKKKYLHWDFNRQDKSIFKLAARIRQNTRFIDYLSTLRTFINSRLNFNSISKRLLIIVNNTYFINYDKLCTLAYKNKLIEVKRINTNSLPLRRQLVKKAILKFVRVDN